MTRGLMCAVWLLSLRTALTLGGLLGWFIFTVLRIRREVSLDNLRHAFPEKSERERVRIARCAYQNFAKMCVEFLYFPAMGKRALASYCEIQNRHFFDRALEMGKGAILMSGHFGNWELIAVTLALFGYPISSIAARQQNPLVDQLIIDLRARMGNRTVRLGEAARGILKTLRKNEFMAILADQDARGMGIFVDFLGRPCSVHQGPAVFALKTGAPIIFGLAVRRSGWGYRVDAKCLTFEHLDGLTPENIRIVTEKHVRILEDSVRRHPDHWFWMHRRWKTQPEA